MIKKYIALLLVFSVTHRSALAEALTSRQVPQKDLNGPIQAPYCPSKDGLCHNALYFANYTNRDAHFYAEGKDSNNSVVVGSMKKVSLDGDRFYTRGGGSLKASFPPRPEIESKPVWSYNSLTLPRSGYFGLIIDKTNGGPYLFRLPDRIPATEEEARRIYHGLRK